MSRTPNYSLHVPVAQYWASVATTQMDCHFFCVRFVLENNQLSDFAFGMLCSNTTGFDLPTL
jgi:hypothetical protein